MRWAQERALESLARVRRGVARDALLFRLVEDVRVVERQINVLYQSVKQPEAAAHFAQAQNVADLRHSIVALKNAVTYIKRTNAETIGAERVQQALEDLERVASRGSWFGSEK